MVAERVLWRFVAAVGIAIVVVLGAGFDPAFGDFKKQIFTYEIDGKTYRVPRQYVVGHSGLNPKGRKTGIALLQVLLPSLDPLPWTNRTAVRNRDAVRVITIKLDFHNSDLTMEMLRSLYLKDASEVEIDNTPLLRGEPSYDAPSLEHFKTHNPTFKDNHIYLHPSIRGQILIIRCDPSNRLCTAYWRISPRFEITYKYRREQLVNWREIDTRVYALIESFKSRKAKQ